MRFPVPTTGNTRARSVAWRGVPRLIAVLENMKDLLNALLAYKTIPSQTPELTSAAFCPTETRHLHCILQTS
jgi:hypothetical protein